MFLHRHNTNEKYLHRKRQQNKQYQICCLVQFLVAYMMEHLLQYLVKLFCLWIFLEWLWSCTEHMVYERENVEVTGGGHTAGVGTDGCTYTGGDSSCTGGRYPGDGSYGGHSWDGFGGGSYRAYLI